MIRTLQDIKKSLAAKLPEFKRDYAIREVGIFGSYARQEQSTDSDVDILVDFDKIPGLLTFCEIEDEFEKALNLKVDLVRKQALRPELKERILREVVYLT